MPVYMDDIVEAGGIAEKKDKELQRWKRRRRQGKGQNIADKTYNGKDRKRDRN